MPWAKNRLYGRQHGPRLSARQQRLVDELLPRMRLQSVLDDGRDLPLSGLFDGNITRFHLEIGFGGGEHLIWQAIKAPEIGFIGCEPFVNGVAKLLSAIEEFNLKNIRIHDNDARDLLDWLPPGGLEKVYILFPDPWPKKRHHKRRIINQNTLNQLARVMKPGAHLCFASDIPDYVSWTKNHINDNSFFVPLDCEPAERPQTRYEKKAVAAGRTPVYLTFVRTSEDNFKNVKPAQSQKACSFNEDGCISRNQETISNSVR